MGSRQPVVGIVRHGGHNSRGGGCGNCCCFKCCPSFHFDVLGTAEAKYKITEAILAGVIQSILLKYGHSLSSTLGFSYDTSFTTSSASFLTCIVLLITYVTAPQCINTLRAPFELWFHAIVCILYLSSGGYLAFSVSIILLPLQLLLLPFTFPALTASYVLCFVASIIHGIDAYKAYRT
ncbi:protein singles bar [Hetaerina americana]|uniref:protein singles bar n=1 Tax=Hetaerina americana TaxID=62018 RepID=UPI003A7F4632